MFVRARVRVGQNAERERICMDCTRTCGSRACKRPCEPAADHRHPFRHFPVRNSFPGLWVCSSCPPDFVFFCLELWKHSPSCRLPGRRCWGSRCWRASPRCRAAARATPCWKASRPPRSTPPAVGSAARCGARGGGLWSKTWRQEAGFFSRTSGRPGSHPLERGGHVKHWGRCCCRRRVR